MQKFCCRSYCWRRHARLVWMSNQRLSWRCLQFSSSLVYLYPSFYLWKVLFLSRTEPPVQNLFTHLKTVFAFGTCASEHFRLNYNDTFCRISIQHAHSTEPNPVLTAFPLRLMHDFTIIHVITSVKDRGQVVPQVSEVPSYKLANRKRPRIWAKLWNPSAHITTSRHWTASCWTVYTAKRMVTWLNFYSGVLLSIRLQPSSIK
jgi:hypothetical protein